MCIRDSCSPDAAALVLRPVARPAQVVVARAAPEVPVEDGAAVVARRSPSLNRPRRRQLVPGEA
eukprot:9862104-Alexandrium_andersonii.AAC.1